jgi:hypothetical protein
MSSMHANPRMLARAAGDLEGINASMSDSTADAAVPTTDVTPAASDVVSALVAAQFAAHAHAYQAVSSHFATVQTMLAEIFSGSSSPAGMGGGVAPPVAADRQDEASLADASSRPLLATAAACEGLAANLQASAAAYAALIAKLTDKHWQDPVAASMAAGMTPHVAWLSNFADQAKQAAAHAEHAADWLSDRLFRSA